ncbi:hypothetical protein [Paeniglutamicibacter terrestris]|uniref:Uncharacterized protein n=1 Tax=Paeniglutamicibacter terrestris TaxID=2723403 RepID=A0ABX1FZY3_9MICC|nr:hypothetical protein [Paeniglutamicibacter terrestris]ASN38443.1 hypothetical protein CGQ24_05060 [Arthrobacter sp. 7749]NKG19313.1 hypothetical protein [Paeniglutamicibacter terrestris]
MATIDDSRLQGEQIIATVTINTSLTTQDNGISDESGWTDQHELFLDSNGTSYTVVSDRLLWNSTG